MELSKGSLKKNILRVFITNVLIVLTAFIGSFVFPKILSYESYAHYHEFLLYIGYLVALHLGFPSGMVLKYAGKNITELDKNDIKTEFFILLLILTVFTFVGYLFGVFSSNKLITLVSLAILPYCFLSSFNAILQALGLFNKYSIYSLLASVSIPLLSYGYFLLLDKLDSNIYIFCFLIVHWLLFLYATKEIYKVCGTAQLRPIVTKKNWEIEKNGFLVMLGNYIVVLFNSIDKQCVNIFFSAVEFAYYSFGISMQAIMSIFITSFSQPLYPAIASGKISDEKLKRVKELLLIFGSYSGCAYFVVSYIVTYFIPKYLQSLDIVRVYFFIFPAMAIVNCLFVTLYKARFKIKIYVKTLAFLILFSACLNIIAVNFFNNYLYIGAATVIIYYIWAFIASYQFNEVKINFHDELFLIMFFLLFFSSSYYINNQIIGLFFYFVVNSLIIFMIYGDKFNDYLELYKL